MLNGAEEKTNKVKTIHFKKKKTCGDCACFLPYFVVAQERGIPKDIIRDPTNPKNILCVDQEDPINKPKPCSNTEFI
jgi:hypothetical protein